MVDGSAADRLFFSVGQTFLSDRTGKNACPTKMRKEDLMNKGCNLSLTSPFREREGVR